MPKTFREKQVQHAKDVEANRAMGVIDYKSGDPLSSEVWEVTEGKVYLPGIGKRGRHGSIGEGHRFHPTERQVEQSRKGFGGLANKARPLSDAEMDTMGRNARRPQSTGADIGLRALPMAAGTASFALENGLSEADFDGVEPEGRDGQYTRAQVTDIIAARKQMD